MRFYSEDDNKLILIDNGIGDKQDDKFLKHYYLHGDVCLNSSLEKLGYSPSDITDVFLTHLHLTTVEVASNGIRIKVVLKWLLRTLSIGVIKTIGNGQHSPTIEKKLHF